jgi:hypothetical protein
MTMKAMVRSIGVAFVLVLAAFAQPPHLQWMRTFGGPQDDIGSCVRQTSDEGFIVVGTTDCISEVEGYIYLIRTNDNGDTLWTRTFGRNGFELGASVQETEDGGYVICGSTMPTGSAQQDVFLVKTDANGDTLWTRSYGEFGWCEQGYSVRQTSEGGYIIAGRCAPPYQYDWVYLIKTDDLGIEQWHRFFSCFSQTWQWAHSVCETRDGGYVVVGQAMNAAAQYDVLLFRTDINGDTVWAKIFNIGGDDIGYSVEETSDQGYIVTGSSSGQQDALFLMKTDYRGDSLWTLRFRLDNGTLQGRSVQQTSDGGYVVAGIIYSLQDGDAYILKTDSLGDSLWACIIGEEGNDEAVSIQQTLDGGYVIAGTTQQQSGGDRDMWLIRLGSESTIEANPISRYPQQFILNPPYPDPFNPMTSISYEVPSAGWVNIGIYNVLGQQVERLVHEMSSQGPHSVLWNAGGLPSGIYFCRMEGNGFEQVRKIVLLK